MTRPRDMGEQELAIIEKAVLGHTEPWADCIRTLVAAVRLLQEFFHKSYSEEGLSDQLFGANVEIDNLRKRIEDLRAQVEELLGPFTCRHEPAYRGGACAACHSISLDELEEFKKLVTALALERNHEREQKEMRHQAWLREKATTAAANEREQIQLRFAVEAIKERDALRKELDRGPHPLEKLVDETLDGGSPT